MSSDENPPGSEDEALHFEEVPDLGEGPEESETSEEESENPEGAEKEEEVEGAAGYPGAYPKTPCPAVNTDKCPAHSYGKPDKAKGVPKKAQTCPNTKKYACPYLAGAGGKKASAGTDDQEGEKKTPPGAARSMISQEAFNTEIGKRDDQIKVLKTRLDEVTNTLRMKNIMTSVEEQIEAGHLAPSQREKTVNFLAALPDGQHGDFLAIVQHQKFPLTEEIGNTPSSLPGEKKEEKIGDSEGIENLSEKQKAELQDRFGITEMANSRGIKRIKPKVD